MNTSDKNTNKVEKIERRLREELFLIDPYYRKYFTRAIFDKSTNSLHGSKYTIYYNSGQISLR